MSRVVQVSFNRKVFEEVRSAARQTNLPIASYVQEVIEVDLAARRMTSPPLSANTPAIAAGEAEPRTYAVKLPKT